MKIKSYAATEKGASLEEHELELGDLANTHVEIKVETCGLCHSDLSMIDNEWGESKFPIVPGHEIIGTVTAVGDHVTALEPGTRVGLGWYSASCMVCDACMAGDHNLCPEAQGTIMGRPGGFAETVRCHWAWATKIPDSLDAKDAGPLFCGGITVFNPIIQAGVRPTDRVGVVGIGGLGHLALQFLNKWGCEVTAFSSHPEKSDELRSLGAHEVVNSREESELEAVAGKYDFILSTVAVDLEWEKYIAALSPKGRLHTVGIIPKPVSLSAFPLIIAQKSFGGSPLGSPSTTRTMIDFCTRHAISPMTEHFKMSDVNEAIDHLRAGDARYRVVLDADFD
ncbi:MAG: NAD(P)-dependent alcohol dehydrogenase [Chthoniobacterales bacterium]